MSGFVLITGASSGIGEAFARAFAARREDLILVARSRDKLHALAEELRGRRGVSVEVTPADLSRPGAAAALADSLAEKHLEVETLVNNAGFGARGRFWALPFESLGRADDRQAPRRSDQSLLDGRVPAACLHDALCRDEVARDQLLDGAGRRSPAVRLARGDALSRRNADEFLPGQSIRHTGFQNSGRDAIAPRGRRGGPDKIGPRRRAGHLRLVQPRQRLFPAPRPAGFGGAPGRPGV
ncbi:MAG: hypothetical protein DMG21_19305 [Acidobacteria bacterium]|nr:MAG: hypothetical protein DMG21_19305 [Acidobacteriota bacterium]